MKLVRDSDFQKNNFFKLVLRIFSEILCDFNNYVFLIIK